MPNRSSANAVVFIACTLLVIIAVSLWATGYFDTRKFIIFAAVACALITFFGFLWIGILERPDRSLSNHTMRTAIAASTVSSYLVIVGMGVFFVEEAGGMPPIAQTLLTSFTTIVGVVVAFYFGSTAYVDSRKTQPSGKEPDDSAQT